MADKQRRYSKDHDWIAKEGSTVLIGITDFAQQELGDIVFVELPEVGEYYSQGDEMLIIESVKAVQNVKAPVNGEVLEVNSDLETSPEKINESPFEEGWFVKLKLEKEEDYKELLTEAEYEELKSEES